MAARPGDATPCTPHESSSRPEPSPHNARDLAAGRHGGAGPLPSALLSTRRERTTPNATKSRNTHSPATHPTPRPARPMAHAPPRAQRRARAQRARRSTSPTSGRAPPPATRNTPTSKPHTPSPDATGPHANTHKATPTRQASAPPAPSCPTAPPLSRRLPRLRPRSAAPAHPALRAPHRRATGSGTTRRTTTSWRRASRQSSYAPA